MSLWTNTFGAFMPQTTSVPRRNNNIVLVTTLHWRHDGPDWVSNHQFHDCLLNRLFRRTWKKTSKLRVTGLCAGNSPGPVNSPRKWSVTPKMCPFHDVIVTNDIEINPCYAYLGMSSSSHWWVYYLCTLSCSEVSATNLMTGHPSMK